MKYARSKGELPNSIEGDYVHVTREEFFQGEKLCLRRAHSYSRLQGDEYLRGQSWGSLNWCLRWYSRDSTVILLRFISQWKFHPLKHPIVGIWHSCVAPPAPSRRRIKDCNHWAVLRKLQKIFIVYWIYLTQLKSTRCNLSSLKFSNKLPIKRLKKGHL